VTRALVFAQFSAHPWRLSPQVLLDEMRAYAASPSFDELLDELAFGEAQRGAPRGSLQHPLVIAWGRRDRVCFPRQARRALALFPDAQLHWFDACGHFPQWDVPAETARLVLDATDSRLRGRYPKLVDDPAYLAGRASKPAGDFGVRRDVDSRR
jgi:pimeloyl-ACP methyl ester carboxylesterase